MKFLCTLGCVCFCFQPLLTAPKALINIKIDTATRTISVKNQSSGGNVYIISFGDGTQEKSTTVVDYTHTYALPGTYQVCMISQSVSSTNIAIAADTLCKTVEIPDVSCVAQFQVITQDMTVQMIDRSTGDYKKTYWYLEGIKQWVNKSEVTYTAVKPGYYTLRLKVEGNYCSSEKDTVLLLRPDTTTCVANFSFTQNEPYTISFQNLSIGQWTNLQWDFGDGSYSNELNPVHVFAHGGNFKVRLSLLDTIRNTSSEHTELVKIANEAVKYLPDFIAESSPDTNLVLFYNTSLASTPCSYLWSFGDGSFSTDSAPIHLYTVAGKYTVCLTQQTLNKRYTACKSVNVGQETEPLSFGYLVTGHRKVTLTANWPSIPDFVEWDFGDGKTSNKLMPTHTYGRDSIYLVSLKVRWGTISDEVYQIVNLSTNPGKLKTRFAVFSSQLKATTKRIRYRGALTGDVSRIRFEWNYGDGNIDSLNIDPSHIYTSDSVYTVCLKVFNDLTNDSDTYCQQVRVGNVGIENPIKNSKLYLSQQNNHVQLGYIFPTSDIIDISIFDLSGRKIRNIFSGKVDAGLQTYEFTVTKGTYVLRLLGKNLVAIEKIIVF